MFDRSADYPTAVASHDSEGVQQAIQWCMDLMESGDVLTVWTHLKSNLRGNRVLQDLVDRNSSVEHVTGRGGAFLSGKGPVLMAWPRMADIGELVQFADDDIRGLCVISWNDDRIRPWVTAMQPVVLGNGSAWRDEEPTPDLDPVVVEAMRSLTLTVNHNNTIAAGYEKDQVVGVLLALRDGDIPMDGAAMQGWALANGWSGKNPQRLAEYVDAINAGKRPRSRNMLRSDYVEHLRQRAAGGGQS